jgi:hypothetical protein
MKVTKAKIIKAVRVATGIVPEIEKYECEYYWGGKEASLFDERCTHFTTLTHPNITVQTFVDDFKERVAKVESEYDKPIEEIVKRINWNVEFEE